MFALAKTVLKLGEIDVYPSELHTDSGTHFSFANVPPVDPRIDQYKWTVTRRRNRCCRYCRS